MSVISPVAFTQIRVAPEVKVRLRAFAEREDILDSALVLWLALPIFYDGHRLDLTYVMAVGNRMSRGPPRTKNIA